MATKQYKNLNRFDKIKNEAGEEGVVLYSTSIYFGDEIERVVCAMFPDKPLDVLPDTDYVVLGNDPDLALLLATEHEAKTDDWDIRTKVSEIVYKDGGRDYPEQPERETLFFLTTNEFSVALENTDFAELGEKIVSPEHRTNDIIVAAANMILGLFRYYHTVTAPGDWETFINSHPLVTNLLSDMDCNLN